MLVAAAAGGRKRAGERGELRQPRGVVTGSQHERRLLVHARALEHGRWRGASVLERCHAAPRGGADPRVERVHRPPRRERERDADAAGHAGGALAQRRRQAPLVAQQHEHGRLVRALDFDVAAPRSRARQPRGHARVDADVLDVLQQRCQRLGILLDCGQAHGAVGSVERCEPCTSSQRPRERRALAGDQDPVLAAAVAAELHVVAACARFAP